MRSRVIEDKAKNRRGCNVPGYVVESNGEQSENRRVIEDKAKTEEDATCLHRRGCSYVVESNRRQIENRMCKKQYKKKENGIYKEKDSGRGKGTCTEGSLSLVCL